MLALALFLLAAPGGAFLPPPRPLPKEAIPTARVRSPNEPHVLYLNFDGATLNGDNTCSNALTNCSFIVNGQATVPAYNGTAEQKAATLDLVRRYFAPFNVTIVTSRPTTGRYSMVMVGGKGADIGTSAAGAVGLAPVDCGDMNDVDISFAFANEDSVKNNGHVVAVTIAQEAAHGYGLSHTTDPHDVMFPYISKVETGFLNTTLTLAPNSIDCSGGTGNQNSHTLLLANVGAGIPDMGPPTVTLRSPGNGESVASGFDIVFDAADDRFVLGLDLFVNGEKWATVGEPPWAVQVIGGSLPAGEVRLKGVVSDAAGNTTTSEEITINVKAIGESAGDPGTACSSGSDCNGGGLCASVAEGAGTICTRVCGDACPSGFTCNTTASFQMLCAPLPSEGGGCSAAPISAGRSIGFAGLLAVLLGLALFGRRSFRA